ncbi:uncharacterized protein E0L32_002150 [Thyridium curvatum]|uniref:Uncharacterized protein n=1 Tax=Thyridium curvatum TaxID=1093900 RepID=A0A507AT46_9PEZI|nr:uncharacterized protein E0L32_001983 [Thyridium curvatum]XP_030989258.1 uncharacterized protein E0L32_002150 [Thyridium curvatum]TPX07380.1 hypothetical protein E0L32_001983 [Thyridium curvatum]TPX07547.1 hypothetical protein E0L32_002150 [Thyridium curvatum]
MDGPVFAAKITVYDGGGALLHELDTKDWKPYRTPLTVPKNPLRYDVKFEFLDGEAKKKRQEKLPAGLPFDIRVTADPATTWST